MVKNENKHRDFNTILESLKENFISDFDINKSKANEQNKKNTLISEINDCTDDLNNNPKENVNYAKVAMLLSNFFFSLSAISIKIMNNYKTGYNYNLFSGIRFFVIFLLSYRLLKYKGTKIESLYKVKNWFWFFMRTSSNHFALLFFTLSLQYIRMSTAACVYMIYPIFINILSVFILKERFSPKYLFACIICFFGCLCFSYSERNESNSNHSSDDLISLNYKIFLGILFALLDGFFSSILSISSKFLMKEMNSLQSNMYVGFYLGITCFIMSLFSFETFKNDIFDLIFIIQCVINGLVIYGAFYYLNEAVENSDLSKTSYILYSQVIFNILFGLIFFGEHVYLIDMLAFLLIIGTNVYLTFFSSK